MAATSPHGKPPYTFHATGHTPSDLAKIPGLTPKRDSSGRVASGGSASLLLPEDGGPAGVAVKCYKRASEDNRQRYDLDRAAAEREFSLMLTLDGASGHAARAYALGTCTDAEGRTYAAIAEEYVHDAQGHTYSIDEAFGKGLLKHSSDRNLDAIEAGLATAVALSSTSARVVHRDLSPGNVMLTLDREGRPVHATIIDFSHSVRTNSPVPADDPYQPPTVAYGAPEMYDTNTATRNLRSMASVDVFSLGCLLYFMSDVHGSDPTWATFAEDVSNPYDQNCRQRILEAKRQPLKMRGFVLGEDDSKLSDLIEACTATNPFDRPNADTCVRYLEALRDGKPLEGILDAPHQTMAVLYADGELAFEPTPMADATREVLHQEGIGAGDWWTLPTWADKVRHVTSACPVAAKDGRLPSFAGCANLEDVSGLAAWDASSATDLSLMFAGCASLADLSPLAGWDVSSVTNMNGTFQGCAALRDVSPLAGWQVGDVRRMVQTFKGCTGIDDAGPLMGWHSHPHVTTYETFAGDDSIDERAILTAWHGEVTAEAEDEHEEG